MYIKIIERIAYFIRNSPNHHDKRLQDNNKIQLFLILFNKNIYAILFLENKKDKVIYKNSGNLQVWAYSRKLDTLSIYIR